MHDRVRRPLLDRHRAGRHIKTYHTIDVNATLRREPDEAHRRAQLAARRAAAAGRSRSDVSALGWAGWG